MKKLAILVLLVVPVLLSGQQRLNHLSFDNSRYFFRQVPGQNKGFRFNVGIAVPSVEVITSDNNQGVNKFRSNGSGNFGSNGVLNIVVAPLLFHMQSSGNNTLFSFGENAAEGDVNSAEVSVTQAGNPASQSNAGELIQPPVRVNIDGSQFYNYPGGGALNGQSYLKVSASSRETATISITREPQRGKVYVCIFDRRGNLLAALDPKDPSGSETQSFTVKEDVYVIPLISSKVAGNKVVFEVGDPREVATVEIIEE